MLLTVLRAQSGLGVASDTRAVASVVGNVVDRLLVDVGRGAVVAHQKVLVVRGEPAILILKGEFRKFCDGELELQRCASPRWLYYFVKIFFGKFPRLDGTIL